MRTEEFRIELNEYRKDNGYLKCIIFFFNVYCCVVIINTICMFKKFQMFTISYVIIYRLCGPITVVNINYARKFSTLMKIPENPLYFYINIPLVMFALIWSRCSIVHIFHICTTSLYAYSSTKAVLSRSTGLYTYNNYAFKVNGRYVCWLFLFTFYFSIFLNRSTYNRSRMYSY